MLIFFLNAIIVFSLASQENLRYSPGTNFWTRSQREGGALTLATSQQHERELEAEMLLQGRFFKWIPKVIDLSFKDNSPQGKKKRKQNIKFFLRLKDNSYNYRQLNKDGSNTSPIWKQAAPVKVLIHGYESDTSKTSWEAIDTQCMGKIAEEYYKQNPENNIIIFDWTNLSINSWLAYRQSVDGAKYAAEELASFILGFVNRGLTNLDRVHLIGHSLGGQLAGMAGRLIKDWSGGKLVGRISGVDPAGPGGFHSWGELPSNKDWVLDPSDAKFVDIIHTNGGFLPKLGTPTQCGHVDFYVNGGEKQKHHCGQTDNCAHYVSPSFFADSINHPLTGCKCDSWIGFNGGFCGCSQKANMGERATPEASGRYYLQYYGSVPSKCL